MKISKKVWVSNDGDVMKGLEVWDRKPEWVDNDKDSTPYFDCRGINTSSLYFAAHDGNKMGLKKGECMQATMVVSLTKVRN